MSKSIVLCMVVVMVGGLMPRFAVGSQENSIRQPVFLLCPHRERMSAWSLFLMVDKNDPSKVLSLGLEKLKKKNSKDSSYETVLAAQNDFTSERELIAILDSKNFATNMLEVQKDEALKVSLSPADQSGLHLMISLRINLDQRFVIGGAEQQKRDIVLRYDSVKHTWGAFAKTLLDIKGNSALEAGQTKPISGIVFPVGVGGTGITRIIAVMEGNETITLYDKE
ncbi:MAG: hypothetical protein V1899_03195 [Planctomycetota bacterium]